MEGKTYEMCPHCDSEVCIDIDSVSPCPECGILILPCSACGSVNSCNWTEETWCGVFPKDGIQLKELHFRLDAKLGLCEDENGNQEDTFAKLTLEVKNSIDHTALEDAQRRLMANLWGVDHELIYPISKEEYDVQINAEEIKN